MARVVTSPCKLMKDRVLKRRENLFMRKIALDGTKLSMTMLEEKARGELFFVGRLQRATEFLDEEDAICLLPCL